jgi:DUF1009 family protein
MPGSSEGRIGILAGGGSLPLEIARSLEARGVAPYLVLIEGEADGDFTGLETTDANWGQIGRMIRSLQQAGCTRLVLAGRVRRPDLARIKPDLGLFRALPTVLRLISAGGDDRVLRGVIGYLERHGLAVIGPGEAAPELLASEGLLGAVTPDAAAETDIALGLAVVGTLGGFDVGQAVVVRGGRVEAIEGAEGTDAMLERVIAARKATSTRGGVLVKRAKPGQELRVDLPAIGPATVARAAEACLAGIAVEAGRTLLLDRREIATRADAARLFVVARDVVPAEAPRLVVDVRAQTLDGAELPGMLRRDALKGVGVLTALAPNVASGGVVVVRGHVLGIETGEGIAALLQRASDLRQWGSRRWRRRDGMLVLPNAASLTVEDVAAAAAGLAGIAIVEQMDDRGRLQALAAAARSRGLVLAAVAREGRV